jgi:hypothetical protein
MKNYLLFSFAFMLLSAAFADEPWPPADPELTRMSLIRHYAIPADIPPPMLNQTYQTPGVMKQSADNKWWGTESTIMETTFDYQTHASLSNRFVVWEDGKMAAVATRGMDDPENNFPDRGTGYNFFDGDWQLPFPSARIESERTGWPSIAPLGANGEIVVAHLATDATLIMLRRTQKGTDDWTEEYLPPPPQGATGLQWPRVITSGENNETVHVFAVTTPTQHGGAVFQGQDGALVYYRSTDAGDTWDIQGEVIEGLGAGHYKNIFADTYSLAAQDDMVVLLVGSAWMDLFIMKSPDNGDSWEKVMIWEHPYPFFDFYETLTSDTLYTVDNSSNMAIDPDGMVHVVWGVGRVGRLSHDPPDPGYYSYWPYTDGIGYWNESMGQIPAAENPHHTMMPEKLFQAGMLVGWTQDENNSGYVFDYEGTAEPVPFASYPTLGISSMPTIGFSYNKMFVIYSSPTETYVTNDGQFNLRRSWGRRSTNFGQSWADHQNYLGDNIWFIYSEIIYPLVANNSNSQNWHPEHILVHADEHPGLYAFIGDHEPILNGVHHYQLPVNIQEIENGRNVTLTVAQNYPNPASGLTEIAIELKNNAITGILVTNLTGQIVYQLPAVNLPPGNHIFSLDVSGFAPGIYFYTITADNQKATRKMVVK